MKIYAVFDDKARVYGTPQFMLTDGIAIRTLADVVKEPSSMIAKHPEDFSMYELGSYDEASGKITAHENPVFLIRAVSLIEESGNK